MSRSLKHRKKDNKWRLWSNSTISYHTGWLSEDEMKQFLAASAKYDYKLKVIEICMTFPGGYEDKDTHKMLANPEGAKAFYAWQSEAFKSKNYYEEVDKKFKELTGGTA